MFGLAIFIIDVIGMLSHPPQGRMDLTGPYEKGPPDAERALPDQYR
ncbi:hypothetical protein L905_13840 [Agrobacterium sp. TS43]|nr:hypothetical protein L906_25015 [Agrobacterium sp. TS45]KVK62610.1 hypothetical protein L907_25850 [Agrobacterium sp. C13]KVK69440.1 hypothetical protein L905_13840 [Agrobacterium sp. TS43]